MGERKISTNQVLIKNLVCLFIGVILLWGDASGQTHFAISQIAVYDQNIFRNYLEAEDWVIQTALNFRYDFQIGQLPLRFNYSGDLNLFYYYHDRLSQSHQTGLESFLNLNEQLRCQLGAAFQLRKFKPDFGIYDYQTLATYAQLDVQNWRTTPILLGYRFRYRDYKNLSDLSYQEHHGFFQLKHFFPSRTTVIGELNFGQKKYIYLQNAEAAIVVTRTKPGKGRGQQHDKGNAAFRSDTAIVAYNMTALKAQQVLINLKLAQSLFSTTGLSLEYVRQLSPKNNIRYMAGMDYSYSKDDELYDDPYAYSSHELEVTLTQVLPWPGTLKIYANLTHKKYVYSIASDSSHGQNQINGKRSDQQQLIGVTFQKNFKIHKALKSLTFYASGNYFANESNDRYFDFDGFFVQSGFELVF